MYNIVIVEDEPIELESLHRIISQCVDNAVLHEASTGRKAIQLVDELKQIDMMFVDINIPLPNGQEVIKYLKSKHSETKVVVTTANDDFDILRSMINLRVEDYLLKPIKNAMLIETIKKNLGCNDDDIEATRALKHELITMIEHCQYTQWHDCLFHHINHAYEEAQEHAEDAIKQITTLLDTLNLYLDSLPSKLRQESDKINRLSETVIRDGLTEEVYSRLIFQLMKLSQKLFDASFKANHSNMDFIERAKFHIEHSILDNITLDDIAEKAYVSSCYLSRAFKKTVGVGFSNYITNRKMTIARSLLKFSDLKVNTIALDLSWQDSNYFCRIFKKETGEAPSDYRKMETAVIN